ncbi:MULTISPECIES: urease accessory protein UreD [unclassified Crossiella]|uniref:urease accessory protein UreD n=1 Tax=unclassified Crossiella TaxID=2620835 RepID=UPI002000068E|nr:MULTISPECIES: urease accessory protein UreD [unclassified Crossiella]MCK2243298.1 urease accessory protein UreD [Crossiella sp. S99.2]MCK2254233.1 urease accessory protein UreD [Crossiella sp. S99.1]
MRADAALTVLAAPDGRSVVTVQRSRPPLTLRRIRAAGPGAEVCLVGSAAGPLGGDELTLTLAVGPGAALRLRSTSAQLVQPDLDGQAASVRMCATVGAGAVLTVGLEPTVLAAGCLLHASTEVELAADATLCWRETTVLGRHAEPAGRAVQRWRVRRAGRPLLRNTTTLLDPAGYRSPALLGEARVLTTVLVAAPGLTPPERVLSGGRGAVHVLPEAALVSVLAADTVAAAAGLAELAEGWLDKLSG